MHPFVADPPTQDRPPASATTLRPRWVANVVLFLASELATYLAGGAIDVDGGLVY